MMKKEADKNQDKILQAERNKVMTGINQMEEVDTEIEYDRIKIDSSNYFSAFSDPFVFLKNGF